MNLANRLTLLRVIMIPFFVFFLLKGDPTNMAIAGGIFVLASITDFLDGYIARSRNLVTKFGKFMDPLADKLLVMSAFICLVELQIVPSWIVIVILAREFIVSIFRAIAASEGIVIAAGKLGKYKTTTQMIAIQGAFISDEEVESIVDAVKNQFKVFSYDESLLSNVSAYISTSDNDSEDDEHLASAIKLVVEMEQASISMLQRKFKIGYNRAARLVDEMEDRGIVGPSMGSKPREVLISKSEYETM